MKQVSRFRTSKAAWNFMRFADEQNIKAGYPSIDKSYPEYPHKVSWVDGDHCCVSTSEHGGTYCGVCGDTLTF